MKELTFVSELKNYTYLRDKHLQLLRAGKFEELERSLMALHGQQSVFPDGDWHLDAAMSGLAEPSYQKKQGILSTLRKVLTNTVEDDAWEDALAELQQWQEEIPNSVAVATILAQAYISYAWQLRGGGWADSVPAAHWQEIYARIRMGANSLRSVERKAQEFLPWFPVKLMMVKAGKEGTLAEWYAVFERGVKANTDAKAKYWPLYTWGADMHLERWHGSKEQFAEYLGRAINCTKEHAGCAVAARIVVSLLDQYCDTVFDDLREQSWDTIKQGFSDWLSHHPHVSVLNYFALCCRVMEDKAGCRSLMEKIGHHAHQPLWDGYLAQSFGGFSAVKSWAGVRA